MRSAKQHLKNWAYALSAAAAYQLVRHVVSGTFSTRWFEFPRAMMQGFAPSMLVLGPGFRHAHPEIPTPPPSALETWLCLLCHGWLFDLEFGGFFEIKELDTARTTVFALHALLAFTFMSLVEPIKWNVSLQGYLYYTIYLLILMMPLCARDEI